MSLWRQSRGQDEWRRRGERQATAPIARVCQLKHASNWCVLSGVSCKSRCDLSYAALVACWLINLELKDSDPSKTRKCNFSSSFIDSSHACERASISPHSGMSWPKEAGRFALHLLHMDMLIDFVDPPRICYLSRQRRRCGHCGCRGDTERSNGQVDMFGFEMLILYC